MAITLWTDTFSTVTQADNCRYLNQNKNWTGKTTAEKETLLKNATQTLNRLRYRGNRDSSSQALSWPRTMTSNRWPAFWFETVYMYLELADATAAQVAYDIHRPSAEVLKGQSFQLKQNIAPVAMEILRPYLYHVSPNQYEDLFSNEDPDLGNE